MTAYLNGTKWCDLGPKPDLRFLYVLAAIAWLICSGAAAYGRGCPPHAPRDWHRSFDGFAYPPRTPQWRALDRMEIYGPKGIRL